MFSAQELHDARRSHAQYYLKQLQIAGALYQKGGQQIMRSLVKFDQDWPQIEQGQTWAAHVAEDEQAARLCSEFTRAGADLLNLRHAVGDRIRWFESVLAAARRIGWQADECDTLLHLGRAYWLSGDVDEATARFRLALEIAEAKQDRARIAKAHQRLGEIRASQSAYDEARQHGLTGLTIYEKLKDQRGIADMLCSLGNLALLVDNFPESNELLGRSLQIYQALGDRVGEAHVLSRLGSLAGTQRDFGLAEQYFSISHVIYTEMNHLEGIGQTANMLGTVAVVTGHFAQGEAWFQQSLKVHTRLGNQDGIAAANLKLGEIDQYTGQFERGKQRFQFALEIYQSMKNLYNVAGIVFRLGNLALTAHQDDEAEQWFRQSIDLCRAIDRPLVASALNGLGQIACRQKRYQEAEQFFSEGLTEALARGDTWIIADLHQEWGNMALELNDRVRAREHLFQALDLAVAMEAVPLVLSIFRSMVRLLMLDQPTQALEIAWFVYHHPASLQDDKDEVSPLIETLQAELPPPRAAQIQSHAQTTTLEDIINQLRPY
jgi:tetratricopeptide (TPR) repeat protein